MTQDTQRIEEIAITIPESAWRPTGADIDAAPRDRLLAAVRLNGVPFHAEAWRLTVGEDGCQTVVAGGLADDFHGVGAALAPNGPFRETEIFGEPYLVLIFPGEGTFTVIVPGPGADAATI
jgi:hypothetical protein